MGCISDLARTLRVTRKPDAKVYRTTLKVVTVGFTLLGAIGYVFQLVSASFQMVRIGPFPRDVAVIVLAALAAVALGVAVYLRRRAAV
ncbi:MAG: protein translocase SEC61 complex subunit gamma [Thermoprotei archaeon]|nr:MAG: protein translocase SEC61 complex subunit gamma [Thermoprotei archaeon]